MAHRIGTDRNQLLLLPPSLDDYIDENNPVKVIDVFVDSLDLKETGFKNSIPLEKGCPFRTIAYFREHNSKAIKSVFRQFVVMMKK